MQHLRMQVRMLEQCRLECLVTWRMPRRPLLLTELNRLIVDIAGLQETRLVGFGSTKEKNYTYIGMVYKKRK